MRIPIKARTAQSDRMDMSPYLNTTMLACIVIALWACSATEDNHVEKTVAYTQTSQLGESWDFIDSQNIKAVWHRSDDNVDATIFTSFKTAARDVELQDMVDTLEVKTPSSDHVLVTRKNPHGEITCEYTGHIWVDTTLESYDSFTENTDPNQRPAFYRIIKGTYRCLDMEDPMSWAAKINE